MAYDPKYQHDYYLRHKETRLQRTKTWRKLHPAQADEIRRACITNLKIEVLSHYGPQGRLQCAWPDCMVIDIDMLSLDHVNNDGAKERVTGRDIYRRVRGEGFPDGFQTLCFNHQWKKELMRRRG